MTIDQLLDYMYENHRIRRQKDIAKFFDGGGHKFASGALAKKELSEIISEVLEKTIHKKKRDF